MKNKEYYIRLGEAVERLEEKNCPTDPSKWSYYKSQAKKKFDVYPSAYANGWASKQYGDAGGGWKKCASEATDAQETEFHTQLDKLVHKTFGKSPEEEKMNEKFDRTHLGILKYAYKDIDKINPSDPMYVRVAQMLDKLSKQELQQLIDADIKFISLLAKNRLSKKESVNESHFQVGDKVKMSHGGVGVVKSLDKEDGGDDEKYYNIELPNGDVMKHAPNELTLAETDLKEGLYQDIMRGVKKGDSPFTLVVIKNNKVVKQVEVKTPQAIPANYSLLLKEFPNSRIRIEDATGKIVMGESVNEEIGAPVSKTKTVNAKLASGADMGARPAPALGMIGTVNIGGKKYQVKAFQGSTGPAYTLIGHNSFSKNTGMPIWKYFMNKLQELNGGKKVMFTPARDVKLNESVNESSMSNIDIIAQEAKDFKDFVKEFYNEYKDFPKDRDTIKWLKGVYDNRSTSESVNEAKAIGKKIFSDAKGKLFFGYQNDDDTVQLVDYKTWKKLSMKDLSNEFMANRIINTIVRNERQLNKKVEYNMWSKKTNPSFEDRMDYFIKNNWISNITKTGIKESVNETPVNEGNSSVEIGDIVFFPPANSAATVIDRFGRSVTLKLANGKKVKTVVDKVKLLAQDNVNEGNAFTGALFKARKEGLTEFEFNGKKYPVHKLEEEEKEETLAESKLTKNSLKQIIKEEYHNVKTFMEEKYGFTPELGKVYSNLAAKPFLKEEEEEVIEEYDVENYEDLKEFVQFMAEYKSDINEAEYQGRKVKLGKIMQGDVKKFKVYVKNDKGNVVKVNFGQGGDAKGGTMRIRKDNPEARASFRARHNCDTPGPRWKARYWSCRKW